MSDSIQQLSCLLNEKEEEFSRRQIVKFSNLLKEAKQGEEVVFLSNLKKAKNYIIKKVDF